MTGLEIFHLLLEELSIKNADWHRALEHEVIDDIELPADRQIEITRARLSWSEDFDLLFINGKPNTGLEIVPLSKVQCSATISIPVEFVDNGVTIAWFYPNCTDYLQEDIPREYLSNHLDTLLEASRISTDLYLDNVIADIPILAYIPSEREHAIYTALKWGYTLSAPSYPCWYTEPSVITSITSLSRFADSDLFHLYKVAKSVSDPYHQYLELYHLIEFKFYRGLQQKLISLNPKDVYEYFRKTKNLSEKMMFDYVFEELAINRGFLELLDVPSIQSNHLSVIQTFCNSHPLSTDNKTWCDFLYKIRCGIVHTKEGEPVFERNQSNESLLCNYLLPFLRKLCVFLIEH